ncbi:MAG: response regulator [Paucibacter sp.]|nr:response regulator [Roseateles sp.]
MAQQHTSSGNLRPVALIIEDEASIRFVVSKALQADGWSVHEAETVRQGLIQTGTRRPDLIILDLGLPDENGLRYLQDVRTWSSVPVIVLSARDFEADKVAALDAGADDYLTKPFSVGELTARARASQRRRLPQGGPGDGTAGIFSFGAVEVDLISRTVRRQGEVVHLTPIEYRLLVTMIANPHKLLTHADLLTAVWGPAYAHNREYLRVYIACLRKKLEENPAEPRHFVTEASAGYRLVP